MSQNERLVGPECDEQVICSSNLMNSRRTMRLKPPKWKWANKRLGFLLIMCLIAELCLVSGEVKDSDKQATEDGVREGRVASPNEIDQWPELLVDLPAFGRQVVVDRRRLDVGNTTKTGDEQATKPKNQQSLRKSNRKADPDIKDIVSGLVKLLGGNVNVHVAEPERRHQQAIPPGNLVPGPGQEHSSGAGGLESTSSASGASDGHHDFGNLPASSRINNRGPPSLSDLPPAIPPGLISNSDDQPLRRQEAQLQNTVQVPQGNRGPGPSRAPAPHLRPPPRQPINQLNNVFNKKPLRPGFGPNDTPPQGNNLRQRPPFVNNPGLGKPPVPGSSLPTSGKVRFPSDERDGSPGGLNNGPIAAPPFTSGVPVPEQLVPLQRPPTPNVIPLQRPTSAQTPQEPSSNSAGNKDGPEGDFEAESDPNDEEVELEPSVTDESSTFFSPPPGEASEQKSSSQSTISGTASGSLPTPPLSTTLPSNTEGSFKFPSDKESPSLRPGFVLNEEGPVHSGPKGGSSVNVIRNDPPSGEVVDVITASGPQIPSSNDVFDLTVSAIQGYGGASGQQGNNKKPALSNPPFGKYNQRLLTIPEFDLKV